MRRVVHRGLQPVESDLLEWAHGTFRTTACVADKTRRRSHCKGQMSVNSAPTTTESSSEGVAILLNPVSYYVGNLYFSYYWFIACSCTL